MQDMSDTPITSEIQGKQVGEEIVLVEEWGPEDDLMELKIVASQIPPQRKNPPQAQTFSKRVPRSGVSMLEIAQARVSKKNLEVPGMSTHNTFTILQDVDDSTFSSLALNCGVQLQTEKISEQGNISLLKAKELAQAAIQQAKECKKKREEMAEKTKHIREGAQSHNKEEIVIPTE